MSRVIDVAAPVDPNERLNPVLQGVKVLDNKKVQRVIDVALPFLSLYQPTALISSVALSSISSVKIITNLPQSFRTDTIKGLKELALLTFTIATLALSILMPPVNTLVSQAYSVAVQVDRLARAIIKGDVREALEASANIAISAIYVASVITGAPEVIAISILAQAAFELYQSAGEFSKGSDSFLEGMAKLVMACFRISQAAPILVDLHRNYFGRQVTQVDIDRIFEELELEKAKMLEEQSETIITSDVNHRGTVSNTFNDYLESRFYSSNLNNLDFNGRKLDGLTFRGLRFYNCKLDDVQAMKCKFSSVQFKNCSFEDFTAINCTFKNSSIMDSILTNSTFWNCEFNSFQFMNCDLTKTCLNESVLDKFEIHQSTLSETNFMGVKVKSKSKLKECDLTDALLCDAKEKLKIEGGTPHRFTRPVIGILWNFESNQTYAAIGVEAVGDTGGIALKADYQPRDINVSKLNSEVNNCLQDIRRMPRDAYASIPQELVKRAPQKTEMAKIYAKAKEVIKHSDGLYLPGGADINPDYYGEAKHPLTNHDPDHRRGIYEFSLIKNAQENDLPVFGICRGVQIYNVYQGGTLHQALKGHSGAKRHFLTAGTEAPDSIQDITRGLVGDGIHGVSLHHQGCNKIGNDLYVAMRADDGLPECIMSENGRFVGTQFHPEIYYNYQLAGEHDPLIAPGKKFFERIVGLAEENRIAMDIA
jgi:gamma-glutamyl-gamma-aminobutyrate hydrolase PuuD/uncharacterized protein YjbI with pentapeptide repeats